MDRKLTTILAADLVGYSRLMSTDEEGVITRLRATRAELIDPALRDAGGRIIKTMGDGMLVEFASPVAAVRAALNIQRAMVLRETGPDDKRLVFRIGVNLGDIVIEGDDILGDGVNVAARLETLAPPGGLCISRPVHDQVRGKLDAALTPLGPQAVKNLPEPVDVWRVEVEGARSVLSVEAGTRPSIAVLPFDNMSRDPDQDFLVDGIVEDVITELSRFRDLTVIARNSSFSFRGQNVDVRQVARDLRVRYVVEGSVRRAGDRLRLTAQLIDASDGSQIWAERWDRTMADLFDLQDELTQAIVNAVAPEVSAHERTLARRKPTENLTAWELAQRAHAEYLRYTDELIALTRQLAALAIEADPTNVFAYTLLARAHTADVNSGRSADPATSLQLALAAAERAIELDGRNDQAYAALGYTLLILRHNDKAIDALERGRALNPNNATILMFLAASRMTHPTARDPARTLEAIREALRISPTDPFAWAYLAIKGIAETELGDFEAAAKSLDSARNYPNVNWRPAMAAAASALAAGQTARARAMLDEARTHHPALTLAVMQSTMIEFSVPPLSELAEQLVELGLAK